MAQRIQSTTWTTDLISTLDASLMETSLAAGSVENWLSGKQILAMVTTIP